MSTKTQNPFADLFQVWSENAKGGLDLDQVLNVGRLNAKAFSEAAKASAEGSQAIARRQVEIWQENAERTSKLLKDTITSAKSPEATISKQAEFAKSSAEAAITNARELFEIASKAGNETADLLNQRVSEVMSEMDFGSGSSAKGKKNAA